jgi:hypothetical protein
VFALFISLNLYIKSRLREPSASGTAPGCADCSTGAGCASGQCGGSK